MKMSSRHVLLFLLSFLFQVASSLYLRDHRHPKLRTFLDRRNEHLSHLEPKTQKLDLSRRTQGTGRRGNEIDNRNQPETTGTFINCVFKVGSQNQLDYDCKHSQDVKINWTREGGRLMGTFSTNFHCPKRRDVRNKMQSPQNKVSKKWKQLIRDKRRTVYRDDPEAEDARDEEVQQIEEEDVVPEVNQDVTEGEDGIEDSQVPRPTDVEEEIPDEEDKERPIDATEEDENEDKGQKEVNVASKSADGSVEDKEDPGEEDDVEGEKEVNEVEKEEDDEADIVDKIVPSMEAAENDGGDDNGNQGENEEVPEAEDSVNEEEPIKETPTKDENDDKTNDEGENDEKEVEKSVDIDTVEKNIDDTDLEKENGDKVDTEVENGDGGDQLVIDYEAMLVPIQLEIELIVTQSELPLLMQFIQELLYEAGDYLLSLLMRNLKQRLRHGRIEEKFDLKVETLARSHGNDTDKALLIMKKKIHEQLGKSYQLEIVKYLKQLYEGLKQ